MIIHAIAALLLSSSFGWSQTPQNPDLGEEVHQLGTEVDASVLKMKDKDKQQKQSSSSLQSAEEDIGPLPADFKDIKNEPLSPEEQARILKGAAQRESEIKKARDNFMFGYYVDVESLKENANGKFQIMDQDPPYKVKNYGTKGQSFREKAHVTFLRPGVPGKPHYDWTPPDTLSPANGGGCFDIEDNDREDLLKVYPFLFSQDDVSTFNAEYKGTEKIGEADTYVFFVAPKQISKGHRYYEGYVFVEKTSLEVVVLHGKAVPDGKNTLYPRFTTWFNTEEERELADHTPNPRLAKHEPMTLTDGTTCDKLSICGKFSQKLWRFPVKTLAADILAFPGRDCPIFESVNFFDYVEFGATSSGEGAIEDVKTPAPKSGTPQPQ